MSNVDNQVSLIRAVRWFRSSWVGIATSRSRLLCIFSLSNVSATCPKSVAGDCTPPDCIHQTVDPQIVYPHILLTPSREYSYRSTSTHLCKCDELIAEYKGKSHTCANMCGRGFQVMCLQEICCTTQSLGNSLIIWNSWSSCLDQSLLF